jgi:hypothetical protein
VNDISLKGPIMGLARASLATKLMAAFGLIAFVTIIQAAFIWRNVSFMDETIFRVSDRFLPQTELIRDIEMTIVRASLETRHAILMTTQARRETTVGEIGRLQEESDRLPHPVNGSTSGLAAATMPRRPATRPRP